MMPGNSKGLLPQTSCTAVTSQALAKTDLSTAKAVSAHASHRAAPGAAIPQVYATTCYGHSPAAPIAQFCMCVSTECLKNGSMIHFPV